MGNDADVALVVLVSMTDDGVRSPASVVESEGGVDDWPDSSRRSMTPYRNLIGSYTTYTRSSQGQRSEMLRGDPPPVRSFTPQKNDARKTTVSVEPPKISPKFKIGSLE
jgi:hypothetical protein